MRQPNLQSFLLLVIVALALTACAGAEASFEPELIENPAGVQPAAPAREPANDNPSLADLVVDLDAQLNSFAVIASDGCTYGQGYWKNHPGSWDTTELTLGDQTYNAEQLLSILNTPPRGDATYILAQQLIAAKLNAGESEVPGALAAADAWLVENPLTSDPLAEARRDGVILAEYLDDYNSGRLGIEACDAREDEAFDDDKEFDDDNKEFDDDDRREAREDGECTGANPHPHATTLAADYDVSYGEIMARFCQGYGFGEIELAYLLAEEVGIDVEDVYALRDAGMGWGNVRKELGASPGLGSDKPKGNDKSSPPGQEKKGEDWMPPGQEKKEDRQPPGQSNRPNDKTKNKNK
jgi:hypothetical protein